MLILLVCVGLCNDVVTYPNKHASYPVPVRQFRLLPVGLLQCMDHMDHPKPPCHLLMLPGVTPAHKGLAPFGLSFFQRTLLNLPFKAHTNGMFNAWFTVNSKQKFTKLALTKNKRIMLRMPALYIPSTVVLHAKREK